MRDKGTWARSWSVTGRAALARVAVLIAVFGMAGCSAEFSSASQTVHVNAPALRSLIATLTDQDSGEGGVSQVYFSQDGRTLAAVDSNGGLYLWNTATRKRTGLMALVPQGADTGTGIGIPAVSPNAERLAVGDESGRTYVWDTATRALVATLTDPAAPYPQLPAPTAPGAPQPPPQGVYAVAFSADSQTLAVADSQGFVYLYDMSSVKVAASGGKPARPGVTINLGETIANSLAFSPDGQTLAIGGDAGNTYLWSTTAHRITATMTNAFPYDGAILSLAFSPDGRTLAGGTGDGRIYLWDPATHSVTATMTEPYPSDIPGQIGLTVAFSPDGHMLATSDGIGAYLWDVATHRIIATVVDPGNQGIDDAVFSPDGRTLAAADVDGSTYLWEVPPEN